MSLGSLRQQLKKQVTVTLQEYLAQGLAQNEGKWGDRPEVFVHLQVRSEVDQIADNPLSWLEFLLEIPLTDNEKN